MGRLIITYTAGNYPKITESLKCKSNERAEEIVRGRKNVACWEYYEKDAVIPRPKKKIKQPAKMSLEEMEEIIKKL